MPVSVNFNLENTLRSISSTSLNSYVDAYISQSGGFVYDSRSHSYYETKPLVNNIAAPGMVHINPNDILGSAAKLETSPLHALKAVLVHEMGHAYNATQDQTGYTADPVKMYEWCINREAGAAAFSFKVTTELIAQGGYLPVVGPPTAIDLYNTLAAAVWGIDPKSLAYTQALIKTAAAVYAADPQYKIYCTEWINGGGLPPGYIPPLNPPSGGGGGGGHGGGGGGAGSVKVPGGYWQEVPEHPSDLQAPDTDLAMLVAHTELLNVDPVQRLGTAENMEGGVHIVGDVTDSTVTIVGTHLGATTELFHVL
jgi:hypothetical protein